MKIGSTIFVQVLDQRSETKFNVINIENSASGILSVLGKLKFQKENVVKAWVLDIDKKNKTFYCGNSYFGKFSISENITKRYIEALECLFNDQNNIKDTDISTLKGMVNRCLKYDQWDWYTTYQYLGYPEKFYLRQFVSDSINLRNQIRLNDLNYEKIHNILSQKDKLTLGSIYYLGNIIDNKEAINSSLAIAEFNNFIGEKKRDFIDICFRISSFKFGSFSLINLRNGIAHGDTDITDNISTDAFNSLYDLCLTNEDALIKSIVKTSLSSS